MHVVEVLLPVFAAIALGAVLRKTGFVTDALLTGANRLCYWVGLPLVLFRSLASQTFSAAAGLTLLVVVIGMLACLAAAGGAAVLLRLDRAKVGSFLHTSYRGNLAFVGFAVVASAFPAGTDGVSEAQKTAALVLGPIVVIYNVLAVIILTGGKGGGAAATAGRVGRSIATNPLVIASVAGVTYSLVAVGLPSLAARTLELGGRFALPLALLCVGGAIAAVDIRGRMLPAILSAAIKVTVGPAVGLLAGWALGLQGPQLAVAIIFLASPTAIAAYVLTDQLRGDGRLAAGSIVASTVLSVASLAVAVALLCP